VPNVPPIGPLDHDLPGQALGNPARGPTGYGALPVRSWRPLAIAIMAASNIKPAQRIVLGHCGGRPQQEGLAGAVAVAVTLGVKLARPACTFMRVAGVRGPLRIILPPPGISAMVLVTFGVDGQDL